MPPAKPILTVDALQTSFRTRKGPARAVDGVSFAISPGETYALVGESGCGKSVTALSILQLLPRDTGALTGGRVLLGDREISSLPPMEMRRIRGNDISMIFQEPMTALNPVFTVGNQIIEVLRLHQGLRGDAARRRAIDALDEVGIPAPKARVDEYPHQLSGGMRQRVMIAIALACNPKVLIADEPTTALDVTIQSQILELIRRLQQDHGTAVLLITHDMGVVRTSADRVGVMYAGRLVEEAPADALFARPAHPYTELLLRALPSRGQRGRKLETIEGLVPRATEVIPGCRFHNRCPMRMDHCPTDTVPTVTLGADAGALHRVACHLFDPAGDPDRAALPIAAAPTPPGPATAGAVALEVDALRTWFPIRRGLLRRVVGHVKAVDGVSLRVHQGETLALVGESGCGKTTVGKSIVRLLESSGGSIRYRGAELAGLSRREMNPYRRKIQFVFQDPFSSLDPRLMISETLLEAMSTHRIGTSREDRIQRAEALMGLVGMDPDMIYRYPHEFSGGQRQRIVLARALAPDPELLICDEATSALDVSVQAQILNLMKDLQAKLGLAYIFITHDLSVVEYLADTVAVMYLGRVVEQAGTEELFAAPKHPYTEALLSAVPRVDDAGIAKIVLAGDVPSPIAPPSGCHFHPRCPKRKEGCDQAYPGRAGFSDTHWCHCILYPTNPPPSPSADDAPPTEG